MIYLINRQQVKDARRQSSNMQDYNPLYSVMYMCKGEGKGGSALVRMVNSAPYPMMVMTPDYSLDDVVRFCTSHHGFSILGVDHLGEFDVTVTTYHHLLLQHHRDPEGKPPVMFGPMFVHVRKDFSTTIFSHQLIIQVHESMLPYTSNCNENRLCVLEFVKAHCSRKHKPYFTALSEVGKPCTTGKK